MRTKIQLTIASILFLFVLSCSKDSANSNSSLSSGSSSNANRQIASSQTSDAEEALNAQTDLSIVGQWFLYYDWNCDGSPGTALFTFNADHTWSDDEGYTGIWIQGRHMFMFTFNNSETTYSGVIFSHEIKGIQSTFAYAGSLQGCFNLMPYSSGVKAEKSNGLDANGKKNN